jgi:hypothetical protein
VLALGEDGQTAGSQNLVGRNIYQVGAYNWKPTQQQTRILSNPEGVCTMMAVSMWRPRQVAAHDRKHQGIRRRVSCHHCRV